MAGGGTVSDTQTEPCGQADHKASVDLVLRPVIGRDRDLDQSPALELGQNNPGNCSLTFTL